MHKKKIDNNKSRSSIQGLRSISRSLPHGLKTVLKKGGHNYSTIINKWTFLVGKKVADICYPKSVKTGKELKDGILFLNVAHSRNHKNYAFEIFKSGGPLAILPMKKNKNFYQSSIIWSHKTNFLKALIDSNRLSLSLIHI